MRRAILVILFIALPATSFAAKWTATVPKQFDRAEAWVELINEMKKAKMPYSAVAGAQRILDYYPDLKAKEAAYQALVDWIDVGYPINLRPVFMAGDLELTGKGNFEQSYNLYKATLDLEKKMPKWADNYFARVDKENFPKYLFYQALTEFNDRKLDESYAHLEKALALVQDPAQSSLAKKISRTMARILYEQTRYAESLDIYENYLLKLNPIEPLDWIEGAWNLYRLGRYEQALGYLYNLQIDEVDQSISLEKYIIRALIYRERCATSYTKSLAADFEQAFGSTIEKIKLGESLRSIPMLRRVVNRDSDYARMLKNMSEMKLELARVRDLPEKMRAMAKYLIETEIKSHEHSRDAFEDQALESAARQLVVMGESLRFLQFDVIREQYNPDKVFAAPDMMPKQLMETLPDRRFLLHWLQWGDYWRDERTLYRGLMNNWCQ